MSSPFSERWDFFYVGFLRRRETLTIGQYGADGISLAEAREQLIAAKKLLKSGVSPAMKKHYGKNQIRNAGTFANFTVSYMKRASLADSTRSMKQAVIDRDIIPFLGNKQMAEITPSMVRALCDRIMDRGGNATAVQGVRLSVAFIHTRKTGVMTLRILLRISRPVRWPHFFLVTEPFFCRKFLSSLIRWIQLLACPRSNWP